MRLMLVINPRSAQYAAVEREILEPARRMKGWTVGRFELDLDSVDENAQRLAALIQDGDLVVAAGGDGTASVAVNAVMMAEEGRTGFGEEGQLEDERGRGVRRRATLAVLGYGNFNDTARMLGVRRSEGLEEVVARFGRGETGEIYPLEALVNGKHWRYAAGYVTVGMLAESTTVFETEPVRWRLRAGRPRLLFSLWSLAKWYWQNHRQSGLPEGYRNGEAWAARTTDYVAVNGKSVAQVMRGGKWYLDPQEFQGGMMRLGSFWRVGWMMLTSIFRRVPGETTRGDRLDFVEPSSVVMQAEGEHERLLGVERIEVRKARRGIKVVRGDISPDE